MCVSWHPVIMACLSPLSQACGALEDPQNAGCAEAVQWAFEKGLKQHPGTMSDMSSWELGTQGFTRAVFFNVSLACLRRMVLCPIGYHQPNWPQWCKARWLAAAWMQCVVCHGNDSVVCCLWLQNASFIRRIFFCGRAGKTAPKPAAEKSCLSFLCFWWQRVACFYQEPRESRTWICN